MTTEIQLTPSSSAWLECVLANFDEFLVDHAANERKASSMAMSLVAHYPDKPDLVGEMVDLALEELTHFKQVIRLMQERGLCMTPDEKDPYVNQMRNHVRGDTQDYFLDRLLSGAVIEARGEERFRQLADHLKNEKLKAFYMALANSEQGHHQLFLRLASQYFTDQIVDKRLAEWLVIEKTVIEGIPVRSRLH
ncbi:MAG: tRNA-(ms[2]io[6]A)-hydroxylase [Gammaproteobacteria bacterium]|nr:tRNA-(ms[2]io[6]A)-hydroxylase [Gammaproteobacteria bacterium]MBT6890455.1 tRNA-(ms[2]io[6]A)-hydroxylase [Gammaproteobacteria bacterium]